MIDNDNIHSARTLHKSRQLPARAKTTIAVERSLPHMHWQWRRRSREILALLDRRSVTALPNNNVGLQAAKLLARHYMRLKVNAEPTARANLRLMAPWLTRDEVADIVEAATKKTKPPSAAELGRAFRVTAEEVAALDLKSFRAFTVTQESDRNRQGRRRRNAGSTGRRGRPPLQLTADKRKAHNNALAAARMKKKRALRKKNHASSYIGEIERDGFSATLPPPILTHTPIVDRRALERDGAEHDNTGDGDTWQIRTMCGFGHTIAQDGVGLMPPPKIAISGNCLKSLSTVRLTRLSDGPTP